MSRDKHAADRKKSTKTYPPHTKILSLSVVAAQSSLCDRIGAILSHCCVSGENLSTDDNTELPSWPPITKIYSFNHYNNKIKTINIAAYKLTVDGGGLTAASKSTQSNRAAHDEIVATVANSGFPDGCSPHSMLTKKTNYLSRKPIVYCPRKDCRSSGAVASRAFQGCGTVTAVDASSILSY
ncbi:hypothetical protein Y032_0024g899 [Ancylostoma ceylanicum]|uniref:Uncharacterized protein n=1 Tax=Ancylostoma ceylanicum TaxID=53326 RepID=A0A016UXL5_9BILA|nr:hypothetical protein Y032_0024g899 [Ancylostoma ceylanicum]